MQSAAGSMEQDLIIGSITCWRVPSPPPQEIDQDGDDHH
jgi:hypothetical protein